MKQSHGLSQLARQLGIAGLSQLEFDIATRQNGFYDFTQTHKIDTVNQHSAKLHKNGNVRIDGINAPLAATFSRGLIFPKDKGLPAPIKASHKHSHITDNKYDLAAILHLLNDWEQDKSSQISDKYGHRMIIKEQSELEQKIRTGLIQYAQEMMTRVNPHFVTLDIIQQILDSKKLTGDAEHVMKLIGEITQATSPHGKNIKNPLDFTNNADFGVRQYEAFSELKTSSNGGTTQQTFNTIDGESTNTTKITDQTLRPDMSTIIRAEIGDNSSGLIHLCIQEPDKAEEHVMRFSSRAPQRYEKHAVKRGCLFVGKKSLPEREFIPRLEHTLDVARREAAHVFEK
ncbi:MAG: hypothetical protein FWE16_01775 [Firmicutes bacterium]|nr:hypothetical protein [Bacillota bacterium]